MLRKSIRARTIKIKRKECHTKKLNMLAMLQNALYAQEKRIKGLEIAT